MVNSAEAPGARGMEEITQDGKTLAQSTELQPSMRHKAVTTLISNNVNTHLDKFQSPDQAGFG